MHKMNQIVLEYSSDEEDTGKKRSSNTDASNLQDCSTSLLPIRPKEIVRNKSDLTINENHPLDGENQTREESSMPGSTSHCENGILKSFTKSQKLTLVSLALLDFVSYNALSILAPFFPQEADRKGMSESTCGLVFSFDALIGFLASMVLGQILPRIGLKLLYITGAFTIGVACVLFGTLKLMNDYTLFTIMSFLIIGLLAVGSSSCETARYVYIVQTFPNNIGTVLGILEIFVGLGMSIGPLIGGFVYEVGGFSFPYYVIGSIVILLAPVHFILLASNKDTHANEAHKPFKHLLKIPSVIIVYIIIILLSATWGFLDPTLEPHLRQHNLSGRHLGLLFLLISSTYGICSPFWGWLADKMTKYYWCLITCGLFMSSFGLLLLGPSPLLPFIQGSIGLHIFSLSMIGCFLSMGLISTYQCMIDEISEEGAFSDNLSTYSLVAGLWWSSYSLGEVIGPALGGFLLERWDFPIAATCLGLINITVASTSAIYFYAKKHKSSIPNNKAINNELQESHFESK